MADPVDALVQRFVSHAKLCGIPFAMAFFNAELAALRLADRPQDARVQLAKSMVAFWTEFGRAADTGGHDA